MNQLSNYRKGKALRKEIASMIDSDRETLYNNELMRSGRYFYGREKKYFNV